MPKNTTVITVVHTDEHLPNHRHDFDRGVTMGLVGDFFHGLARGAREGSVNLERVGVHAKRAEGAFLIEEGAERVEVLVNGVPVVASAPTQDGLADTINGHAHPLVRLVEAVPAGGLTVGLRARQPGATGNAITIEGVEGCVEGSERLMGGAGGLGDENLFRF